jgi:glycosyltransferase involved in cell wall biosynthesis
MDYNSRQLFGEKPSPLAYPALSAAGAPFEEENELKKPASVDVTVIIPVYNTAAYLEECLETVLGQDIPNLQVICVNDGSSDSSLALLEKAAAADSRVQVVSQLNGGAGAARNRAINLAKGRYLAFIDPDDTYPASNTLSMLLSKAKENNAAVCGGSFVSVLPEGKKKESYHGDADVYTVRQEGFRDFSQDEFDYGWIRFIYNRSLFEDGTVRFPEYRWYEDPVFLVRVMQKASQYYAVPETTYLYRADYKEPSWNAGKVRDLVNGLKHNYVFAKEQGWNRLYSLIVWRIEEDYYLPIVNCLGDDEVMATISEIQARLDLSRVAYLRERNLKVRVLRPLKDYPLTNRKTAVVRQAEKISDSSMYKALQNVIERKREGHR